jgi:hypothetical protein
MPCLGNGNDHCCYIRGEECPFLFTNYVDETGHFRKWACSLRVKYGNWDDVLADPEWQRVCGNAWKTGLNCKEWPDAPDGPNRGVCKECGVNC